MNIKIDNRERDLIKELENSNDKKDTTIEIVTLPIGDIIIEYLGKEYIIIERKSVSDLEASIKDGRYEEQSYRLANLDIPNHNIVYLIEGSLMNRQNKQMLYSSMFSLNYTKGFSVLRSASIQETAYIICNMVYKLQKLILENKSCYYKNKIELELGKDDKGNKEVNKEGDEDKETPYCNVIKKVKKENITPENIGEIMLCQIPSISSVSAIAVMSHFKTMQQLILSVKNDQTCLNNITYLNSKGQSRKLGKNIITNIIKFLL